MRRQGVARKRKLIKGVIEAFCPRFFRGGTVVRAGDGKNTFRTAVEHVLRLGIKIPAQAKLPDVIVHDTRRNWVVLIEAVSSTGAIDSERRKELKKLFSGCNAGLVFVTAFENRRTMQNFLNDIAWQTEVWVAEDPDHIIHLDGERFLGPYPDVAPGAF